MFEIVNSIYFPSVLYWTFTCLIAYIVIQVLHLQKGESLFKLLTCEMISSFAIVACSMENGFIRKYFGDSCFLFVIFLFSQILSVIIPTMTAGTPCNSALKYLIGDFNFILSALSIIFQIIGGYIAHQYNRVWCDMGWTEWHKLKFTNVQCNNLLVSISIGCLLEFGAVFSENFMRKYFLNKSHSGLTSKFVFALNNAMSLSWIAIGVDLTGMFVNPVNASAQTLWCSNSNLIDHLLVYWAAPLVAVWVVYRVMDSALLFGQLKRKAE